MNNIPKASFPTMAASIERERQRTAMAPQMHLEATARALPDAMFADAPEIRRLTQEHDAIANRVKRLERANRADVQAAIRRIEQAIAQAHEELRGAAVDDALDGDFAFARSATVSRRSEALRRQLEAARLALEVFAKPPPERNQFDEQAQRAKAARADALLERKRAYVAAHPELLRNSPDVVKDPIHG